MSSVNIYSAGGMCSVTLFLASSESSSVFFLCLYFKTILMQKKRGESIFS